jgi:hypothetical protein
MERSISVTAAPRTAASETAQIELGQSGAQCLAQVVVHAHRVEIVS